MLPIQELRASYVPIKPQLNGILSGILETLSTKIGVLQQLLTQYSLVDQTQALSRWLNFIIDNLETPNKLDNFLLSTRDSFLKPRQIDDKKLQLLAAHLLKEFAKHGEDWNSQKHSYWKSFFIQICAKLSVAEMGATPSTPPHSSVSPTEMEKNNDCDINNQSSKGEAMQKESLSQSTSALTPAADKEPLAKSVGGNESVCCAKDAASKPEGEVEQSETNGKHLADKPLPKLSEYLVSEGLAPIRKGNFELSSKIKQQIQQTVQAAIRKAVEEEIQRVLKEELENFDYSASITEALKKVA